MALPPNGRIVDSRRRDAAEWWHYQQAMEAYLDVLIFNRFLTDQIQTLGSSSFSSFSSLHCLSPNQPPRRGGRPTTHQVCRSVPECDPAASRWAAPLRLRASDTESRQSAPFQGQFQKWGSGRGGKFGSRPRGGANNRIQNTSNRLHWCRAGPRSDRRK